MALNKMQELAKSFATLTTELEEAFAAAKSDPETKALSAKLSVVLANEKLAEFAGADGVEFLTKLHESIGASLVADAPTVTDEMKAQAKKVESSLAFAEDFSLDVETIEDVLARFKKLGAKGNGGGAGTGGTRRTFSGPDDRYSTTASDKVSATLAGIRRSLSRNGIVDAVIHDKVRGIVVPANVTDAAWEDEYNMSGEKVGGSHSAPGVSDA